jgi:CRP-like cAMP-binding protein
MPALMNSGASFLSRLPLFADVSPDTLARLEHRMRRREFAPRAVIVREGSSDDAAFLVLSGRVAVRRRIPSRASTSCSPSSAKGRCSVRWRCSRASRARASVVALEATSYGIVEQFDFDQLFAEHPAAVRAMMAALADRLDAANRHVGIDFVNLSRATIDSRVLRLLPQAVVNEHRIVPISFANMSSSYPQLVAQDDGSPQPVRQGSTWPPGSAAAAKQTAGSVDVLESDLIRELQLAADADEDQKAETKQDPMSASEDAPIIKLANSILGLAIKQGASDIHVEPMEAHVTVRFRIDGVLQVLQKLPKWVQLGLISRFKILSRLDIAEKRLPQDGRISVSMDTRPIDFRVSTVPGKWGEKVCMRILDRSNTTLGLDKLISHASILRLVRERIEQPYGIIYVTGSTGSEKTTTLMKVTPRLRAMAGSAARSEDIHAAAIEEGMIHLKRYAAWLLTEGLTSVEEVTTS